MRIVRIGAGSTATPSAETVGAKAANLARMAALGLPVPPAFVLPVALCAAITRGDPEARDRLEAGLAEGIAFLEEATGRRFGDARRPLLVSVRSGAARSMPGMLDTVLDVGCSAPAVRGLVRQTGNPHFAWDCRRRFLESFGGVVLGVDRAVLAAPVAALAAAEGVAEADLDAEAAERLAGLLEQAIIEAASPVPEAPVDQLRAAAEAVYRSWTGERARVYRRLEHLEDLAGTAVTVQAMVYGNRNQRSAAGVAFSRDPSTGAAEAVIDALFEAQGEDVVSGARTPLDGAALARRVPEAAAGLRQVLDRLEREFADVQDVEFTIEDGTLWILQTRSAKRTPRAALRFAVDMVGAGLIAPEEGLKRVAGLDRTALMERTLATEGALFVTGTPAAGGVAVGRAAFDSAAARRLAEGGDPVILVRPDTSTADVEGFSTAAGIVTAVGGRTAHAALVARQMGRPCVAGCAGLAVDPAAARARGAGGALAEGDWLTVDGDRGRVFIGRAEVVETLPDADLQIVAGWRAAQSAA